MPLSGLAIGNRGQQGDIRLPAIQPCVLNNDGNIGLDNAGIILTLRDRFRVCEIIEAKMQRAARANSHLIRTRRITVGKIDHDLYVCICVIGI